MSTRSRRGARSLFGAAALLALALAEASAAGLEAGAPPWRAGGRVGFTVDAAAFPDTTGLLLEVYIRIPPTTLAALNRDEEGTRRLELEVLVRSAYGGRRHQNARNLELAPADTATGLGRVVMMRFPSQAGRQRLLVRLADLNSRKRGLFYLGRRVHEAAELEGELEVPGPQAQRELSDLGFVWSNESATGESVFRRGDRRMLPNPERLFGLFEDSLRTYFVARARPGDVRPWRWVVRVLDSEQRVAVLQEGAAEAGVWLRASPVVDLSRLPAGGYDLEVKAWQEEDEGALSRRARFSVGWRSESWLRNTREVEDIVHLLLAPLEEERFVTLEPGEQERYLEDFWRRRDPTPGTAENEARDAYLERVETANRLYSRFGLTRGMFTDMGRVFIRYGEPTEVLHQVIPAGEETLRQIVAQINASEDRQADAVTPRGIGGDIRPFEVWIYEGEIPAPPDADPAALSPVRHRRLVFLFVDEEGLGYYRLRFSTE